MKPNTERGKRAQQDPTLDSDIVKAYNLLNQGALRSQTLVEAQNEVLSERIVNLEDEISRSHTAISVIRGRIQRLSCLPDLSEKSTPRAKQDPGTAAAAAELTVDTVARYLREQPIILDVFLGRSKPKMLLQIIEAVDDDVKDGILSQSLFQLDRFIRCITIYKQLFSLVENSAFSASLTAAVQALFDSSSVFSFLCDPKTGEYYTKFGFRRLIVSLKEGQNVVSCAAESGKVTVLSDPQKAEFYSPSLDPLFNPDNVPILVIPMQNEAVLLVLHTNPDTFEFSNEDQAVATFLASLVTPLLRDHLRFDAIVKEREIRSRLEKFEAVLFGKDRFDTLLPFLKESMKEFVSGKQTRLFMLKDTLLHAYEIENGQLVELKYNVTGVPASIIQSRMHIFAESLNKAEVDDFDASIDEWAEGRPFAAFPVLESSEKAFGVLCVSGTRYFDDWDFETLTCVAAGLALVIVKCEENARVISEEEAKRVVEGLPGLIASFKFNDLEQESITCKIADTIRELTKAEQISIYGKDVESGTTKRLISLNGHDNFEDDFVGESFIESVFASDEPLNDSDSSRIPNFTVKDPDLKVKSAMCVCCRSHEDYHLVVIALNSTSSSGQFGVAYHDFVKAFTPMIIHGKRIQRLNETVRDMKAIASAIENAFSICTFALNSQRPMDALLTSMIGTLEMKSYIMMRHAPLSHCYEKLAASEDCEVKTMSETDGFLSRIGNESVTLIDDLTSISESAFVEYFSGSSVMIVIRFESVLVIFIGNELVSDYEQHQKYFVPLILTFYANHRMSTEGTFSEGRIAMENSVDVFSTKVLDSDIGGRLFAVIRFTEAAKVEAIVKMFVNLQLIGLLETSVADLIKFVMIVRDNYRSDVGFHNWNHAVDTTQFVYSCMQRGRMNRFLKPNHIAAILLASLCHDVGHEGLNSTFHVNTKSPLFIVYGSESPLEKHQLAMAMKLVRNQLITPEKKLDKDSVFWQFFSQCILATDMMRHFTYMETFRVLNLGFNPGNAKAPHLILIAQLLLKCGNVGNSTRTFDVARSMAENLVGEYQIQGEKEKALGLPVTGLAEAVEVHKQSVAEIEIEFCTAIVLPMLKLLGSAVSELSDFAVQMEDNRRQWDALRLKAMSA